jgi:hypothetical protein
LEEKKKLASNKIVKDLKSIKMEKVTRKFDINDEEDSLSDDEEEF